MKVTCPKCDDEVRLPGGVSDEATVACPLCGEQYVLSEALSGLPPSLVVVHDPHPPAADWPVGESLNDSPDSDESGSHAEPPPFSVTSSSSSGEAPTGVAAVKTGARPAKKRKSVVAEIAKVALGGVAGLVIAQLILWWGFGRDAVDGFGDKVGSYAPWIVPAKFRPAAGKPPENSNSDEIAGVPADDSSSGNGADDASSPASDSDFTFPQPGEGIAARGDNDGAPDSNSDDGDSLSLESPEGAVQGPSPSNGASGLDIPDVSLDPIESPIPDVTEPDVTEPDVTSAAPEDSAGGNSTNDSSVGERRAAPIRDARAPRPEQLGQALRDVADASLAWDTADELTDEHRRELYLSLAKLADVVSLSSHSPDTSVPDQNASLLALLRDVSGSVGKRKLIAGIGSKWVAFEKRETEGIALTGVVERIERRDGWYRTTVEVAQANAITVITSEDPHRHCRPTSEVLVLGRIVEDPSRNLDGYAGEESVIVWGGMIVEVEVPNR